MSDKLSLVIMQFVPLYTPYKIILLLLYILNTNSICTFLKGHDNFGFIQRLTNVAHGANFDVITLQILPVLNVLKWKHVSGLFGKAHFSTEISLYK